MDQRVVECHPNYDDEYNLWIKDKDDTEHELVIYNNNEKLPRMGNGEPRKDAFESGVMTDYLLVTYEDTGLHV
ncbi:hypothetical protein D3C77_441540 [compost metagenome]